MKVTESPSLAKLGGYAFDELDRLVESLREEGIKVIDFGVGDPNYPAPQLVRDAVSQGLDEFATAGYPSYVGHPRFRLAISGWFERRFGVSLDPATEIAVSLGSKEAVFHFPMAVLQPGDVVLVPTPGYPPYRSGTAFAGGEV